MEVPLEINHWLGPEASQQAHLLAAAKPSRFEVLPQRLKFAPAGPHAHSHPKTPATQAVDLRRLLGDEGRLPRGQHEHGGNQFDVPRMPRHVGEQRERLVEMPGSLPRDLFGNPQMCETQFFREGREFPNRDDVVLQLADGKGDADAQHAEPLCWQLVQPL